MRKNGFALIGTILCLLTVLALTALLSQATLSQWSVSENAAGQLRAISLAQSGVEFGRSWLPRLERERVLLGQDGLACPAGNGEFRNPIPLSVARSSAHRTWQPDCDDGYPLDPRSGPVFRQVLAGGGEFWVRFSNNPQEDPYRDEDDRILLRSTGIYPGSSVSWLFPEISNHVALVEACLRAERAFEPIAAVTLSGPEIRLDFRGGHPTVEALDQPEFGLFSPVGDALVEEQIRRLLATSEFVSEGWSASNLNPAYREESRYSRLFRAEFWRHFLGQLPRYSSPIGPGETGARLFRVEEGERLEGNLSGAFVCSGNVELTRGSRIRGLVIHLGGGRLEFGPDVSVEGAVWVSSLFDGQGRQLDEAVEIRFSERNHVVFNREAIETALGCFPATLVYWRMIFPEMEL